MKYDGILTEPEINALLSGTEDSGKNDRKKDPYRDQQIYQYLIENIIPENDDEEEPKAVSKVKYVDVKELRNRNDRFHCMKGGECMKYLEFLDRAIKQIPEPDAENDAKLVNAVAAIKELANIARKEGLLALEECMEYVEEDAIPQMDYLRLLVELIVDGTDPELVKEVGLNRIVGSQVAGYEALLCIIYLRGMLSIQAGENPILICAKLTVMLPERVYKKIRENEKNKEKKDFMYYYWRNLNLPETHFFSEKPGAEKKEEEEIDPIEELCKVEKIGLNETTEYTNECYFEMRLLEHMLKTLDDRSIQRLLRDTDDVDLRLIVKGLSGEVNSCILRNLSHNAALQLATDVRYIGPVRLTDVREAARTVLEVIFKLEMAGEIIAGEGEIARLFLDLLKENDVDQEKQKRIRQKETELETLFKQYKKRKRNDG